MMLRHHFWRSILFISQYYESVKKIIDIVYLHEREKIKRAGVCAADTIEKGGLIHVFGCGHSHMVGEELFYRAGGLAAVDSIFEESAMLHSGARKSSRIERMSGYARLVMEQYSVEKGDCLIICSSSGINSFPIEMAEEAGKHGAVVIGITSSEYFGDKSRDKEGRHLADLCDFFIDNHVPHGDAVVDVKGGTKAGPVSSISSFFIANEIILETCEELLKRGIEPPIFKSGNIPGGDEHNERIMKKYAHRIKHL